MRGGPRLLRRSLMTGGSLTGGCYIPGPPPEHAPAPSYGLVDVLDPDSGTWEALPPLPLDLVSTAPIVVDNQLYVVGLDQTVDSGASDPAMSHVDVVVARYVPPATTLEEPAAVDPGAGGCGG